MALEKERLMAYFQEHYLSRQEVLYKLPLSLSIDAFWPELLNRRKATAAVLPLYNAAGMPYWYVQTQRMVHASEQLCEAAMAQADGFDPYRAQMTSAMTEEMFFTSFVEGAQIPLQEAMDFLQRGTEPEKHPGADDLEQPLRLAGDDQRALSPFGRTVCPLPCLGADAGDGQRRRGLSSDRQPSHRRYER